MDFAGINPENQYLWLTLAGFALGSGISFFSYRKPQRHPVAAVLFISLSILFLTFGIFLSSYSFWNYRMLLLWFGVLTASGFLCVRFWRFVGIPVFSLFFAALFIFYYSFASWSPVQPGQNLCSFTLLSGGGDKTTILSEDPQNNQDVLEFGAGGIYPEIRMLELPPWFFLSKTGAIYEPLHLQLAAAETGDSESAPAGKIRQLFGRIPGFILVTESAGPLYPVPGVRYDLSFNSDGLPAIKKRID